MPRPSLRQVVDGVERHLGIVGAGLDAQVTARPRRVEGVPGEGRQVDQGRRAPVGQAEPAVEQGRPEADGEGEAGGGETEAPRRCRPAGRTDPAGRATACPAVIRSAASVQVRQQGGQTGPVGRRSRRRRRRPGGPARGWRSRPGGRRGRARWPRLTRRAAPAASPRPARRPPRRAAVARPEPASICRRERARAVGPLTTGPRRCRRGPAGPIRRARVGRRGVELLGTGPGGRPA